MTKGLKLILPPAETYLSELNLEKVAEAIAATENGRPMAEFDFEDAKRLVWAGAERWLALDLHEFRLNGVEKYFEIKIPGQELPLRGFMDARGHLNGLRNETAGLAGVRFVLDWKTSRNTLDERWRDRLTDSWQWRLYAYKNEVGMIVYRGLSRNGETKEILIRVPESNDKEVEEYMIGVAAMRKSLVDAKLPVWPRHMPGACNAFGQECPFYTDCQEYSMPQATLLDKGMSYTQFERLLLCPERHRRLIIQPEYNDSEESNFGQAVHRGLAELWTQAFEKFSDFKREPDDERSPRGTSPNASVEPASVPDPTGSSPEQPQAEGTV